MRPYHAVVFDLDDTLYAERDFVLSGFRAAATWAASSFGINGQVAFGDLTSLYISGVRGDTFNRWIETLGRPASTARELVGVYREHSPTIRPFPGITELLSELRRVYRLGLVSDGYLSVQQRKLSALGIAEYFDAVVFSDAFGPDAWKPSPIPFLEVLRQMRASPDRSIYVADNPRKDFIGARELGMRAVWARYSKGDYCVLEAETAAHAADDEVHSVVELRDLLLCGQFGR